MPIISASPARSESERKKEYRKRGGTRILAREAERMRKTRRDHPRILEFTGVDSEGIGEGYLHRAVLLGVGANREGQYENLSLIHI